MKNVGQTGFDFGDVSPAHRLDANWTWTEKPRSMNEHMIRLADSRSALDSLVGIPHAVFSDVLLGVIAEHDRQVACCSYDDKRADAGYRLWGHTTKFSAAEYETIIAHCTKHDGCTVDGVEYKVRTCPSWWSTEHDVTVGMHVPGIGTVRIGRYWDKKGTWHSMRFKHIERDTLFLQSYQDDAPYQYCSGAVWAPAYSAQLIGEAHKKIPNVRTFKFGGREYVNTGAAYCGDHSQCSAWAIMSAEEWSGDTFSYADMTQAWDRGASERGDMRGLLVRVRGQLCVLEKYMTVYDDQPRPIFTAAADEEDEIGDEGLDENFGDGEEEEELETLYA
jgi:hypothetical protein